MKSTHERMTDLANDIYLLHDTAYDLRHDVGAVINNRVFFDIDEPLNTIAINLMREVKVEAEKLLASINQQIYPLVLVAPLVVPLLTRLSLPHTIRDNKQFKKHIKIMLTAVKMFCRAVDEIMTPTTPVDGDKQVDKRRAGIAAFAAKVKKEEESEALMDSINAMCKDLKEAEGVVKRVRFQEGIRSARQT